MSLVLDGSAALAWCFEDATTAAIDDLMMQVASQGAVVPALWRLEVANGLQADVRRRRLSGAKRDQMLTALCDLPIVTDAETDRYAWTSTIGLAERHNLTVYDASYLELAIRLQLPLASLDEALRQAAATAELALLGTS